MDQKYVEMSYIILDTLSLGGKIFSVCNRTMFFSTVEVGKNLKETISVPMNITRFFHISCPKIFVTRA